VRVKELMVTKNLLVVKEDDRLALAGQMMTWGRLRHLPVVRGDEVVGVVSERQGKRRDRQNDESAPHVNHVEQHPGQPGSRAGIASNSGLMVYPRWPAAPRRPRRRRE
jgi:CBS domain